MASIDYQVPQKGDLRLIIQGRLDVESTTPLWSQALKKLAETKPETLVVDVNAVDYCDGTGIGLLLELRRTQQENNRRIQIEGLKPEFQQLMTLFDPGQISKPLAEKLSFGRFIKRAGQLGFKTWDDLRTQISFLGELAVKFLAAVLKPGSIRWTDTFLLAEKSGADAVGITCMLGFLIGLILAFQSARGMEQYGAQIYVADLVALVLFRELGPLITAIIFAARSGSAYAAELGTMKVNEEIDAMTTMGLDPVKFLAVPRMIAGLFMMPLLTMFNLLSGLIGCGLVMLSLGFPPVTFLNRIQNATSLGDFTGGMVKTLVFGMLVAGIGCLRGLQTGTGASAVGDSATRAVVTSIIAIVVVDGVFAVVYFFLGV